VSSGEVAADVGKDFVITADIDASAGGLAGAADSPYTYVNLMTGARVDIDDVEALDNPDWHIAFKRASIRLNGGDSGTGDVTAGMVDAAFEDVDAAPADFVADDWASDACEFLATPGGEPATAIGDWYDYDPETHVVTPVAAHLGDQRRWVPPQAGDRHLLRQRGQPDERRLLPRALDPAVVSRAALTATGLGAVLALLAASTARADRPALVDAESLAGAAVRVHFTRTGADAVPTADDDGNGIPDVVQAVATHADAALAAYAELGLRPPLADDGLADDGGDGRIDFYLMDLEDADGMFAADTCTAQPTHCTGHLIIENDFVGFGYPSVELAIKTLTSHELFHAVQAAYDADQPVAWSEGTAVWAEELVFPEQDDFEHLVAAFLERPARPFERGGGGFGDAYPYGAALWPYFLEQRFGVELLVAIWDALEDTGDDPEFLDATEALLPEFGVTLDEAWIEFTRWNAETGSYAAPGHYPEAARLAEAHAASRSTSASGTVTTSIEGLSARYLALLVEEDAEITVTAARGVAASVAARRRPHRR
jgi:hypothetical protein